MSAGVGYSSMLEIQPPPDYWSTNFLDQSSFAVPISSGNEIVEFDLNDLPETREICYVLENEKPPVRTWNIIALHYLVRFKEDAFLAILEKWLELKAKGSIVEGNKDDEAFCMDLLANYYALKFSEERDRDQKKVFFNKAQKLYTQVEKLFVYSQYHLVGRAYLCLFDPEKIEQAATQFEFVLTHAPADYLALQGRGIVAFQKGDYKKSLHCFRKVLIHHPACSPDIRMAIGHCLFKLQRYDKAKKAYDRTLQLDPHSVGAMVGKALILLNEETGSVQEAMKLIVDVYNLDKTHPINLNLLADHFFYRKEPEKAINLSAVAIQTSQSELLKAESAYMLGRSHHYKEEFDQAFQYYYQATQFAKQNFVLPWYGLGQMYIQRCEYTNAIQCFEKVLTGSPNNVETLKMLGLLYLHTGSKEKLAVAKAYLKKVIDLCPEDIDAHIKYAELQEVSDKKAAKDAYMQVVDIYKREYDNRNSTRNECPAEILNNISVICFQLGQFKEARKFLVWAKSRAEEEKDRSPNEVHYGAILVTMAYNEGRINEAERRMDEAHICYTNILRDHLNYVDCYLRFGCLERDRGNILQASDWFKEAGIRDPDNADSHLLLGNLHMSKSEYGPAQKKFEKILSNAKTKKDTYALLSVANIWLESLYTPSDQEKKRRHSERAFQMFREVLKVDPTNVYAVNGMGAILAKTGQLEEAREMFSVVRESTAEMLDLWLNIGHSYCDQKQYVAGIKMYENAIKRFKEASLDPVVFLYLARAHYFNVDLAAARKTLQIARRFAPQNQVVRYNLGIVLKKTALDILKDAGSSFEDVKGAIMDLSAAEVIFEFLKSDGDKHAVDPTRAEEQRRKCNDLLTQCKHRSEEAKRLDDERQLQREEIEKARRNYQEKELMKERQKEELQVKQQEELLKKRQEVLQRTAAVKERIVKQEAGEVDKPARKRPRKERPLEDGFIDDGAPGGPDDGEPRRKRRRDDPDRRLKKSERRRRRERQREEGGVKSSSEEDEEPTLSRKDIYDGKGRKYLSKAYISGSDTSSSSDSDDEDHQGEGKKSSEDESDNAMTAEAGKAALASSDEETALMSKKSKVIVDSEEEEEVGQNKKKMTIADEDDEDLVKDDVPKRAKLSLNESDSD